MKEITNLVLLTKNSVSIEKQKITTINGVEYLIGDRWNKQYCNSPKGRLLLESEIEEPYKSAILSMWGNTPTIEDVTQ